MVCSRSIASLKKREAGFRLLFRALFFVSTKYFLVQAANGASPILGKRFPRSTGSNAVIGIAHLRIVLVAAGANVFHSAFLV